MPVPYRYALSPQGVTIEVTCRVCGTPQMQLLTHQEYDDYYKKRELAQIALARLTKAQREVLISGTCGPCWDKLFPPEDGRSCCTYHEYGGSEVKCRPFFPTDPGAWDRAAKRR